MLVPRAAATSFNAQDWPQRLSSISERLADGDAAARDDARLELADMTAELCDAFVGPSAGDTVLSALSGALSLRAGAAREPQEVLPLLEGLVPRAHAPWLARLALAVGVERASQGDVDLARQILEFVPRACAPARAEGIQACIVLAGLELYSGAADVALERLDRAQAQLDGVDSAAARWVLEVTLLGRRIEAYMLLGLPDVALPLSEREEQFARHPPDGLDVDPNLLGAVAVHRCDIAIGLHRYSEVGPLAQSWLPRLSEPFRSMVLLRRAVAQAELAAEDLETWRAPAEASLREALGSSALDAPGRVQGETRWADLMWLAGDATAARDHVARAEELAQRLPRVPASIEAYLADLNARMALESGAPEGELQRAQERLTQALEAVLGTWRAVPRRAGGVPFLHYSVRRRWLSTLVRMDLAAAPGAAGTLRALGRLERVQRLGSLTRFAALQPPELAEDLAALTADGAGALVYLPGRSSLHVFLVDAGGPDHVEVRGLPRIERLRSELEALAGDARDGSDERAIERLDAFARELSKVILPATFRARLASWRAVTVVGGDLLGYAPFELMELEGKRLGESIALSYVSSLPQAGLLARRVAAPQPARDWDLLALAAPKVSVQARAAWPRLEPIPFAAGERALLGEPFDEERVRIVSGTQASRAVLDSAALGRARALGFLVHGVHSPQRERSAGLVLAPSAEGDDGILWCDEVERLEVPPLVFIAACGAGRGAVRKGEDAVANMGGAFLAAGARVVVVTSYDLDSRLALELSRNFFAALQEPGVVPAEALRRARVHASEIDPKWARAAALVGMVGLGARVID